jgi:hypothetical protein
MKSINYIKALGAVLILSTTITSCRDKAVEEVTYTANVPIYMNTELIQDLVGSEEPRELSSPGKIHINGNRLFIVDQFQGVHVFDNSNPSDPINMAYLKIPGVVDIASRGFALYADSYTDLLTIDVADLSAISVADRDEDAFTQILPPTNNEYPMVPVDEAQGTVVGWKVETIKEKNEVDLWQPNRGFSEQNVLFSDAIVPNQSFGGATTASIPILSNGTSGSMARFTSFGEYLYAVDGAELKTFSLVDISDPVYQATSTINRVVETIFPMDDKLFIGTTTGMVIYDLANPASPVYLSDFNHSTSCDPVVVEDDFAYVTLRTGTNCGGWINQLDVVDISNINSPSLVSSYSMTNPHGLGISNNVLFICDGNDGLKVYDATDKYAIDQNMIAHFEGIQSYDVIPMTDVLLMVGEDGFFQYDYSDLENITLLSQIRVQ